MSPIIMKVHHINKATELQTQILVNLSNMTICYKVNSHTARTTIELVSGEKIDCTETIDEIYEFINKWNQDLVIHFGK